MSCKLLAEAFSAATVVSLYTGNDSVRVWSGGMGFGLFMVSIVMMRTGRFSRTTLLCERTAKGIPPKLRLTVQLSLLDADTRRLCMSVRGPLIVALRPNEEHITGTDQCKMMAQEFS